ncbi:hypothetical protein FNV43_RR15256 [Rhamnella rubrinervis]|uniref:AAA+ ATPase domain-containing protein n=1 Tax=Rhamnella rubrinervis TaxID=2594499 RepID=A0A8K0GU26_9ROSA|nr:hypothetical protein FNV43_RR15256 [Rhamnella rubrinervis]
MALTQIANFVVGLVKPHLDYVIQHDGNVEQLRNRLVELRNVKERIGHEVADALSRSQKIEADVEEWQKRVEGISEQAQKLLEAESQAQMCFYGLCPNFITLYNPSRKALGLAKLMEVEVKNGNGFRSVAYTAPLRATTTTPEGFQALASRTSIVTQILEEFKKDNINKIGVFGMAGVGKSTFAKQVAVQAKKEKLFDIVGEVEVKQNPDMKSIQNKLALSFGLQLDKAQNEDERKLALSDYIKDKKQKILIILDDIWEWINLETLGLEEGYCKILLTSRDGEMLHSEMGTPKNFRLEVLDEEETWSLFEKKVGDAVKHPDIRDIAIEIAKRCAGLPILVETIAITLRGKPIYCWNDALTRLNSSGGEDLLEKVYSGIEWSYNQLDDENVKSLFLICAVVWDRYVHLSNMIKYTMGLSLKLFEGIDTMERAYERLQSSVDKLKGSCLLLDTDNSQIFKMHDLTRDVGRKIASRDKHYLCFRYENESKECFNKELLQKCAMMLINSINIPELLQDQLECQDLQLFKFCSTNNSLQIPATFFKKLKQLKVLDLTNLCIPSLPPSIQSLTSLQTLCLDQCELRDISIIGELRSLEILSLVYSKLKQLPKEMGKLTRLRSLDLRCCPELEVIYPDVIKSLTRLEELNMHNSFNKWETEEASNNISERSNASLSELQYLPNLTTLGINIKDANQLPFNFFSEKLKYFKILIGDVWERDADLTTSKTLKLKLSQRNQWDQGLEKILKRCEDLSLDVFEGVNSIVYQLDMDGFQRLKKLHVQNNSEISHILNSKNFGYSWIHSRAAFPILEELSICNLVGLENVCSGQLAVDSFRQLKIIKVQSCAKLKNLFSLSTILHFLQLEEIEVKDCNNMKEIIVGEKEKQPEIEANDPIKFHRLQSLSLQGLPEVTCFASNPKLHETSTSSDPPQLFNDMVVFPMLQNLTLSSIPLNKMWDGHFSERMSWIQNLTYLIVDGCDGLTFFCSSSMAIRFVQLKTLEIRRCKNMVKVISTEGAHGNLEKMDKMFPRLQTLKLDALRNLEMFCTSSATYFEFPCLLFLYIKGCTELGCFIFDSTTQKDVRDPAGHHLFDKNVGFPNLKDLHIEGLDKLTTIWHIQLASDSFYKLTNFRVKMCRRLIHIFGPGILERLHSFQRLFVDNCESVQEVFNGDHGELAVTCQNLFGVSIDYCRSLKIVFPAPVARVLGKLEILRVTHCENMELIVGEEDQIDGEKILIFQSLTYLIILFLPNLRSFYPGMHPSMWPLLRRLLLLPSEEHENLAGEYSIYQQQQHEHDQLGTPTKRPLFLLQKSSMRNLEELHLTFRDGLELPLELLKAKNVRIYCTMAASAAGLSVFLKKFHNLQQLEFIGGAVEEMYVNERGLDGEEEHVVAQVKSLRFERKYNLIHLWKENSKQAGPVFQNLEILKVENCGRLESIVSSAISFRNLVQLEVLECRGLIYLLTCSVAKSLVQLQNIRVENCFRMVEFIASDDAGGDADDGNEITFSRLRELKLRNLPHLRGFCSPKYDVKFPFLTTLSVTDCLEMKISPDGLLLNDSKHQ